MPNISHDAHLLLWSFSFKNFPELIPNFGPSFNWSLFSELIVYLSKLNVNSTNINNTDELCLYLKSMLACDLDNGHLITNYFHSNANQIEFKNITSDSFYESLIRNIIQTVTPGKNIQSIRTANCFLLFTHFIHLTNGNLIQLVTILLEIFLDIHDKYTPQSAFDFPVFFRTFNRVFGSDFVLLLDDIKKSAGFEFDKFFIKEFYGDVEDFRSKCSKVVELTEHFFGHDSVKIKSFQEPTKKCAIEALKKNSTARFDLISKTCSICLDLLMNYQIDGFYCHENRPPCHEFHQECLKRWLLTNSSCPLCRSEHWKKHK